MSDNRKRKQLQPQPNNPNGQNNPNNRKDPSRWRGLLTTLFYVVAVFLVVSWFFGDKDSSRTKKELSYTKFTAYVESNMVEKLVSAKATIRPMHYAIVFGDQDSGEAAKGLIKTQVPSTEEVSKFMDSINADRKEKGLAAIDVTFEKSKDYWYLILVNILPFLFIILFFVWMSRGISGAGGIGGIFGVGKAQAQVFDKEKQTDPNALHPGDAPFDRGIFYSYDFTKASNYQDGWCYMQFMLKYRVLKNMFVQLGLKTHGVRAEFIDAGLGVCF